MTAMTQENEATPHEGKTSSPLDCIGMTDGINKETCEEEQHQQQGSRNSSENSSVAEAQRDNILSLSRHSPVNPKASDFNIIWQNLTYKVDSRHWHTKLRERIFRRTTSNNNNVQQPGRPDRLEANVAEDGSGLGSDRMSAGGERTILRSICGSAKSRQLTGILGPSGAGKSSLLYCLFQNRTQGVSGRILVDSQSKKRLKVCFIPQKDHLNEWLTVREDLIFVSKLRCARVNLFGGGRTARKSADQTTDQTTTTTTTTAAAAAANANTGAKFTYAKRAASSNGERCSTTLIDHEENAFRVAELLGITNCLDVPIRRISGGQKKRLSVARELMSAPDILILDEPTTGLDSLTCTKMISVLADLAHYSAHPMAVIVTIHQPQRSVFDQFDKTYFLSSRGRVVYDDKPQNVIETLRLVANLAAVPAAKHNPASALIEIFSDPQQAYVVELMASHAHSKFAAHYDGQYIRRLMRSRPDPGPSGQNWTLCAPSASAEQEQEHQQQQQQQQVARDGAGSARAATPPHSSSSSASSHGMDEIGGSATPPSSQQVASRGEYFISRQLRDCLSSHASSGVLRSLGHVCTLTHRSWLSVIRDPTMTRSRLLFHAALPLIMLLIFGTVSGAPNNCPSLGAELEVADLRSSMTDGVIKRNIEETRLSIENMSLYFLIMYGFAINIISTTASHYPQTILMFNKETINGLYSAGPYFVAQLLADLPLEIFFPSFSVMLAYSLSGQIDSYLEWRMFAVTGAIFLLCYSVHAIGLLCGSIFINNIQVAVLVGQTTLFPLILLSGFLIRTTRMPQWMRHLSEVSVFKQALKSVVAARYGFNVCDCDESTLPGEGEPPLGSFRGMPPNVRHVLEYMFPPERMNGVQVGDMFDKLGQRFIKTQTFALNITTCADVRPYVMEALDVQDADLYRGALAMVATIIILKLVTFSIVRVSPYRIH